MANPTLGQSNFELSSTKTSDLQTHCSKFDITTRSQSQTPISRKTVTDGGSIIQEKYRKLGYSEITRNFLLANWGPRTLKNYSKYIDLWKQFASMNSFDIFSKRLQNVLNFLSKSFSDGHNHSSINTASSALSSMLLLPTFAKYHMIWDVRKVFNYFRNLPVMSNLTLKELSLKLVVLLCLVSGGQRMQTMHLINLKNIKYVGKQVFIPIMQKIKQSKPGNHIYSLSFKTYPRDTKLCAVAHLKRYIELTQDLRSSDKLFISCTKHHQAISRDTISRWCKTVTELSGIDIQKYSTHSTRSAASSKAKSMGMLLKSYQMCRMEV